MAKAICKTCGGEFSNPAFLIEHWNLHHKDRECGRCHIPKARPNGNLFCSTCERDLERNPISLTSLERLEKHILRSARRSQRWENRTANLLALRSIMLNKQNSNGHLRYEEFCGHGNKKGQCIPCNPIFEKMTEKTWAEAEKSMAQRTQSEMAQYQARLNAKKRPDIIEVTFDDD